MKLFEQVNLEFFNQHSLYECQSIDNNLNKEKLVGIWVTYFKICYYACIVPFKPVFNPKTSRWKLDTNKFQKVHELYKILIVLTLYYKIILLISVK